MVAAGRQALTASGRPNGPGTGQGRQWLRLAYAIAGRVRRSKVLHAVCAASSQRHQVVRLNCARGAVIRQWLAADVAVRNRHLTYGFPVDFAEEGATFCRASLRLVGSGLSRTPLGVPFAECLDGSCVLRPGAIRVVRSPTAGLRSLLLGVSRMPRPVGCVLTHLAPGSATVRPARHPGEGVQWFRCQALRAGLRGHCIIVAHVIPQVQARYSDVALHHTPEGTPWPASLSTSTPSRTRQSSVT